MNTMDLTIRPRRLRTCESLRRMVRETRVSPDSLVYPLFLIEGEKIKEPIESLDGQHRYSPDRVCEAIADCRAAGAALWHSGAEGRLRLGGLG